MSYIEIVQKLIKEILNFENVSIGKVKPKENVIFVKQTGGKGYSKYKVFGESMCYEIKVQIVIFNNYLSYAFKICDSLEEKLDKIDNYKIDNNLVLFCEKINGPVDLDFDEYDRKMLSLNYIINIRKNNKE